MLRYRLGLLMSIPALLVVVGTVGYQAIEGWPLDDAAYMTVLTISTVGFHEVHPLSDEGRMFTSILILGGVFTLFYAATEFVRAVIVGEVGRVFGRQRMERRIGELNNHMVVCGYGRMGRLVCHEFDTSGVPYVVLDRREDVFGGPDAPKGTYLVGDATSDEVLRKAGIERARGLVAAAASDADNLYITMSARFMNEKLLIVARAEDEAAERKLLRAGATRVISPYAIGGRRIAQAVLRPAVMDFIELATHTAHMELQMEEVEIRPGSRLAGVPLRESGIRRDLGIIIIAIKRPDERMLFNPESDVVLEEGHLLITLGHRQQLDRLERLAGA